MALLRHADWDPNPKIAPANKTAAKVCFRMVIAPKMGGCSNGLPSLEEQPNPNSAGAV
jgi:hypothetical protein